MLRFKRGLPEPTPDSITVENITFLGTVSCIIYDALLLIDALDQYEETETIPRWLLLGATVVTASYLQGFTEYGTTSETFHATCIGLAFVFFGRHLSLLNTLERRTTNTVTVFTVIPLIFLLGFKLQFFKLQSCSSMRLVLVFASLVPLALVIRSLRQVAYDATMRRRRIRLVGLYMLNLIFHIVVNPMHACYAFGSAPKDDARTSSLNLLFDMALLAVSCDTASPE